MRTQQSLSLCQPFAGLVAKNRGWVIRSQALEVWASGAWAKFASYLLLPPPPRALHFCSISPIPLPNPEAERGSDLPKITKKVKWPRQEPNPALTPLQCLTAPPWGKHSLPPFPGAKQVAERQWGQPRFTVAGSNSIRVWTQVSPLQSLWSQKPGAHTWKGCGTSHWNEET